MFVYNYSADLSILYYVPFPSPHFVFLIPLPKCNPPMSLQHSAGFTLSMSFSCSANTRVHEHTHTHTQGGSTSEHPRQTITVWNSGYYSSSRALLYLPSTILPPSLTHTSCLRGGERGRERMRWERERQGEGGK